MTAEPVNSWLMLPAINLVEFLAEEIKIAGITERAILSISGMPKLLAVAANQLPDDQNYQAAISYLIEINKVDAKFAAEEIAGDMIRIRSHHLVAIWAAIETTIERTLINHLLRVPDADGLILRHAENLKARQVKITEVGAKSTIKAWESSLSEKETMPRQIKMLKAFDLDLKINDYDLKKLSEMAALRDIILHNQGLIDSRFLRRCPWRTDAVGEKAHFDRPAVQKYIHAATQFAIELSGSTVRSKYFTVNTSAGAA